MFTSTLERWPCHKAGPGPWAPLLHALQTPVRSQFSFCLQRGKLSLRAAATLQLLWKPALRVLLPTRSEGDAPQAFQLSCSVDA